VAFAGLDLTGRVAVVVGGTSGIGRALASGLAQAGADVVASSRRADAVAVVAGEIEALGRRTLPVVCDVANAASLERLRDQVLAELGRVDVLVNCAGRTRRQSTLEMSEDEWRAILDTNLLGTLRACRALAPHMLARGSGRIINVVSLAAFVAFHEVAAYAASKAAVAALTKSLAVEWGPRGVNVNGIAPGIFPTDLNRGLVEGTPRGEELRLRTPLSRFGRVEELVGAAIFLGGEILVVDGGFLASGVNQ
jgi:NAD(P)-dependent dehydrogenase (short-subunit alcohol dehydrogenase family)